VLEISEGPEGWWFVDGERQLKRIFSEDHEFHDREGIQAQIFS